jgi:hypothetical protein
VQLRWQAGWQSVIHHIKHFMIQRNQQQQLGRRDLLQIQNIIQVGIQKYPQ